jgi:hypothetical protein
MYAELLIVRKPGFKINSNEINGLRCVFDKTYFLIGAFG